MRFTTVILCALFICFKGKEAASLEDNEIETVASESSERPAEPIQEREVFMGRYFGFFSSWTRPWTTRVRDVAYDNVDLSLEQKNRSLIAAAKESSVEKIQLLLENGADPNFYELGWNALIWAAKNGSYECMEVLLKAGANPNKGDWEDDTPLIFAVRKYSIACMRLLLDFGANPNIAGEDGETALYNAVNYDAFECAKFLLDNGADPNIATEYGETPLQLAIMDCYQDIASLLRAYGATH